MQELRTIQKSKRNYRLMSALAALYAVACIGSAVAQIIQS
jgi:hypothetical protein